MQLLPGPKTFEEFLWGKILSQHDQNGKNVGGLCRYADTSINLGLKITNLQIPQMNFDILREVCVLKQPVKIHHVMGAVIHPDSSFQMWWVEYSKRIFGGFLKKSINKI